MKKIAVITYHRSYNYGAVLQAYATVKFFENQGFDVKIIDYYPQNLRGFGTYKNSFNDVSNANRNFLVRCILTLVKTPGYKKLKKAFDYFIDKELPLTDSFYSLEELKNNLIDFDIYCTGSDQVWSPFCTGGDLTYFLDFVKDSIKCNSYAACVGIASDTFLKSQEVVSNLKRFNHISVREEIAQRKLSSILSDENREGISLDLDPTLLLSGEEWNKVATNVTEEHYIFVYSLSMPNEVVEFANKLAKSKHEKIIFCTLDNLFAMKNKNNTVNPSPEEFLGYIKNADYVVTNSFHGTVFSIIFKKVFFVIKNVNPNHDNSRLTNVLSLLALESQLVDGFFSPDNLEDIDYLNAEHKLEAMKKLSKAYINRIISE